MKTRHSIFRVFGLLLLGITALAVSGCFGGTSEYDWRQKVTLMLETPDGEISASSVQEVRIVKANSAPAGISAGSETYLTAEAVVVNLGRTESRPRYLFALIGNAGVLLQSILTPKEGARTHEALSTADDVAIGTVLTVPRKNYPLLVTFDDINDPASVKRVNPDDLDAAFGCPPSVAGQGSATSGTASPRTGAQTGESADAPAKDKPCYTLKSITLEITDEPVTKGKVETVLGWLKEAGRRAGGLTPLPKGKKTSDYPDPQVQFLGPAAFSTEWNK